MARKEPVNKALETRRRLRELAKYYCATASLPKSNSENDQDELEAIRNYRPAPVKLSIDHNLTALCQLAALRLDCARCFVSILDSTKQHVIAEATRTVSCFDINDHAPGDELILGMQSFPMGFGICSTTIGLFTGECKVDFGGSDTIANADYICVPDLLAEKTTKTVPALQGTDILRFYLEVPIRTSSGYVIGSICVIDPKVRNATPKDIKVMQEMASLVMTQLEMTRMKEDHRRTERLLDGLAHFIRGKESISQSSSARDSTEETPASISNGADPLPSIATNENNDMQSYAFNYSESITRTNDMAPMELSSKTGDIDEFAVHENSRIEHPYALSRSSTIEEDDAQLPVGVKIKRVFGRAANLLRQSMDLDACCFVEIPQNERFKAMDRRKNSRSRRNRAPGSFSSASQSQESSNSSTDESDSKVVTSDTKDKQHGTDGGSEVLCHRLGFSSRDMMSTSATNRMNNESLTIPAALLSDLAARYPQGNIFHFDSMGSVSSSSDEQGVPKGNTKSAKKKLATKLFKHFPTGTSVIFLPLYSGDMKHMYSSYIGWTSDKERGLQRSELVYVAGFANSIMCEVMRLEAQATDKAKSDFISSISHELRSPLHGILAASQLLGECQPSAKQVEYLSMIDTCGRTLLDIMNHLLDHAKINHFTKDGRKRLEKKTPKTPGLDAFSLTNDLNLLTLVEETASSMSASSNHFGNLPNGVVHLESHPPPVPIILSIHPAQQWTFSTEPGSWRRIIMNLVGNSIKYTQEGHIIVDIKLRHRHHHKSKAPVLAELRVTDTGQGISEEYLKHRLYTPFAQENNLSVGAGLGLSLVQKIVSSLGGNIDISSELGSGTEVLVTLPLEGTLGSNTQLKTEAESGEARSLVEGKTVLFDGFDCDEPLQEDSFATPDTRARTLREMKHSLMSIMIDWFGLKVVDTDADLVVIEESQLDKQLTRYDIKGQKLIVTGAGGRSNVVDKIQSSKYVYFLPPTGPVRMSQALKCLFKSHNYDTNHEVNQAHPEPTLDPLYHPLIPENIKKTIDTPNQIVPGMNEESRQLTSANLVSQASSISLPQRHADPEATQGEAILLVDDNDINLRILTACISRLDLHERDVSYITATNGKEALDRYIAATNDGTRISVIFMDISMPIMDGFTSTREIRAFEKSNAVAASKIIALTGLASAEAQSEIEACGFDLYLRKPVNLKTVREILKDETV